MKPWRAIYCVSGRELAVAKELQTFGFEIFCPFERFKRHKAVRGTTQVTWINEALFPGYFFIRSDFVNLEPISGAIDFVKMRAKLVSVPEALISALRAISSSEGLIRSEDLTRNSAKFKASIGDEIRFKDSGPFAGLIGKIASLTSLDESGEVQVWLDLLGSPRSVRVHYSQVKPRAA